MAGVVEVVKGLLCRPTSDGPVVFSKLREIVEFRAGMHSEGLSSDDTEIDDRHRGGQFCGHSLGTETKTDILRDEPPFW